MNPWFFIETRNGMPDEVLYFAVIRVWGKPWDKNGFYGDIIFRL